MTWLMACGLISLLQVSTVCTEVTTLKNVKFAVNFHILRVEFMKMGRLKECS